jgi:hypothetical protein
MAGEEQLRLFADHREWRLEVFPTDQPEPDIRELDRDHRQHATVEDRIREGKNTGMGNLPFPDTACNQVWLKLVMIAQDLIAWTQALALEGELSRCEVKRLCYRLIHQV